MTCPSQPVQFVLLNLHPPWDVMQCKEYHYDGMPSEALSRFLQGKLQDKKRRLSQKVTPVTQMRKSVTRRSLCPMNFPVTLCIIRHISLGKRGDTGENRAQGNRMGNPAHLPAFSLRSACRSLAHPGPGRTYPAADGAHATKSGCRRACDSGTVSYQRPDGVLSAHCSGDNRRIPFLPMGSTSAQFCRYSDRFNGTILGWTCRRVECNPETDGKASPVCKSSGQAAGEFLFLCFFLRVISCLPGDVVTMYLGATKTPFWKNLLAGSLGLLPGMVLATFMGESVQQPQSPMFWICGGLMSTFAALSAGLYYWYRRTMKRRQESTE